MELSNFSDTLILHEINFGWFQKVKNCLFNYFGGFEFWFWEKFYIWAVKNSKFRTAQMVKMAVFGASKWPTLISRKIWVAEKSINFYIEHTQLCCPGLYILLFPQFRKQCATHGVSSHPIYLYSFLVFCFLFAF